MTNKTLNVTFNHSAETVPEFLGLTVDRAHEIQSELQDSIGDSDSRNADIEHVFNTYNDAELVWALFLTAPTEQYEEMQSGLEGDDTGGFED